MVTILDAYLRKELTRVEHILYNTLQYYNVCIKPSTNTTEDVPIKIYVNGKLIFSDSVTVEPYTQEVSVSLYCRTPDGTYLFTVQQLLDYIGSPNATQITITAVLGTSSKSFTVSIVRVTQPPSQPPSVTVTKVSIMDVTTGREMTSVNSTDNLSKYALMVYYSSTGTGKCKLTVTVGGKWAWSGDVDIQSGSNNWGVTFTWLAKGTTIADLISQYGITGNQITICADISNVTA
jgi:hypothetical protein